MTYDAHVTTSEGTHVTGRKFWNAFYIRVGSQALLVRNWGKTGSVGQVKVERFASASQADLEHHTLVRSKRGRGYTITENSHSGSPSSQAQLGTFVAASLHMILSTGYSEVQRWLDDCVTNPAIVNPCTLAPSALKPASSVPHYEPPPRPAEPVRDGFWGAFS